MTTYFDTEPAPRYCPMCGERLGEHAASIWASGLPYDCRRCGFEYAKAPEPVEGCSAGHEAQYRYPIPGFGEIRCAMCDLREAWSEAETMRRKILDQQSKLQALAAIIEEDARHADAYRESAETIAARVVEFVRQALHVPDIRNAVDINTIHMSAEQMDADRVEIGTAQITYRSKADPFIAID